MSLAANPTLAPSSKTAGVPPAMLPGIILCSFVAAVAYGLEAVERALFGKAWMEALVIAILVGTAIRSIWSLDGKWHAGINFCAKYLLEIAIVLLGASLSGAALLSIGPELLIGIAGVVATSIAVSFCIGKLLGLPVRMALLVACGNSICGNSAIAAVAPVIGADSDDVAASIAFTAVLGVAVVLGLPLLGLNWGLNEIGYGALAGLTVYAVPQVIAAASPLGAAAVQMGMIVKLVRVLMLGPVCVLLSLMAPRLPPQVHLHGEIVLDRAGARRPGLFHLLPWFIIGFVALAACRSLSVLPAVTIAPMGDAAAPLTVVSMAALGLGVDVRSVAQAGGRVTIAVVLSLFSLSAISLALLAVLGLL